MFRGEIRFDIMRTVFFLAAVCFFSVNVKIFLVSGSLVKMEKWLRLESVDDDIRDLFQLFLPHFPHLEARTLFFILLLTQSIGRDIVNRHPYR